MDDREAHGEITLGIGGGVAPFEARVSAGMTRRWSKRGVEAVEPIAAEIGLDALDERLLQSEELDTLVARAVNAAAETAVKGKRQLLGRLVRAAVLDDAKIDESSLLLGILSRLEGPHIRCLEAIYRAEREADDAGNLEPVARGAERPYNQHIQQAAEEYPALVLKELLNENLLDGSISWDSITRITGLTSFGVQLLRDLRADEAPT